MLQEEEALEKYGEPNIKELLYNMLLKKCQKASILIIYLTLQNNK